MKNYIISVNLFADISDHLPNFIIMKSTYQIKYIRNRPKLNILLNVIYSVLPVLENISWENVMTCKDTDECFDIFL